ncbi:hypothetical protein HHK36_006302 [Tetracentron sinense]|uniref:Uncharacterized protein n=1 Tax=Tetracentron sinense TaxID=13715 RepID=A0A835DKR0_TETSI|nr:hypothetical protein HHK36_006302 [Tetracentron sinense]
MEAQYHDSLEADNLSSLQRFEEILLRNKMEIANLELQVQSYRQKLARTKKCAPESSNGYMGNACCRVKDGVLKNFMEENDNLCCEIEAMSEKERGSGCNDLEEGKFFKVEKESETDLRVLSLNQVAEELKESGLGSKAQRDSHDSKVVLQVNEVEQVHMRLRILEEEAEVMKKAFFGSVEERTELLKEISQQFQIIYQCLRSRVTREKSLGGFSIDTRNKDGSMRTGLLQVLHRDTNPSLVTRVLRANMLTFHDPAGAMNECLNR